MSGLTYLWYEDILFALFLVSLVLTLMVAYSIRIALRGRISFDRIDKQGGSVLLNKRILEMGYWGLQPIAKFFVFFNIHPNTLSFASLVFAIGCGVSCAFGHFGIAAFLGTYSALLDSLDGIVSRMAGVASMKGELLDASIDRYTEFFTLLGLSTYFRENAWLLIITLMTMIGSFMISYSTAKAEALHISPPSGMMRRPERAFYLILGCAFSSIHWKTLLLGRFPYPIVVTIGLMAILTNFSAIKRLYHISNEISH